MNDIKCGFCAEWHDQKYKCANCGHTQTKSQMSNFYEHRPIEWGDKVCPSCGFKSFKPDNSLDLSEKDLEEIRKLTKQTTAGAE